MTADAALKFLKASADPTRLRLLALLAGGEATVGELVEVLGQSQPRVSRHLRLLAAARLVAHFRDGQWVYYRLDPGIVLADLLDRVLGLARAGDATIAADQDRMAGIRRQRERYAFAAPTPSLSTPHTESSESVLEFGHIRNLRLTYYTPERD